MSTETHEQTQHGHQHNLKVTTTFSVVEREIHCQHKFQFYVDYGSSHNGPWLKVGLNQTEFSMGYLPQQKPLRPCPTG